MDLGVSAVLVLLLSSMSVIEIYISVTRVYYDIERLNFQTDAIIESDFQVNNPWILAEQSNTTFLNIPGHIQMVPCNQSMCGNGKTITRVRVHENKIVWVRF